LSCSSDTCVRARARAPSLRSCTARRCRAWHTQVPARWGTGERRTAPPCYCTHHPDTRPPCAWRPTASSGGAREERVTDPRARRTRRDAAGCAHADPYHPPRSRRMRAACMHRSLPRTHAPCWRAGRAAGGRTRLCPTPAAHPSKLRRKPGAQRAVRAHAQAQPAPWRRQRPCAADRISRSGCLLPWRRRVRDALAFACACLDPSKHEPALESSLLLV
jgi:hypothetical protein